MGTERDDLERLREQGLLDDAAYADAIARLSAQEGVRQASESPTASEDPQGPESRWPPSKKARRWPYLLPIGFILVGGTLIYAIIWGTTDEEAGAGELEDLVASVCRDFSNVRTPEEAVAAWNEFSEIQRPDNPRMSLIHPTNDECRSDVNRVRAMRHEARQNPSPEQDMLRYLETMKSNLETAGRRFRFMAEPSRSTVQGPREKAECDEALGELLENLGPLEDVPSAEVRLEVEKMSLAARMVEISCNTGVPTGRAIAEWETGYQVAKLELERLVVSEGG